MTRLISERDKIRGVAKRWASQYKDYNGGDPEGKKAITRKLSKLNPETATPDDVERIIGNRSWTNIQCAQCEAHVPVAAQFTGYDDSFELCLGCVRAAAIDLEAALTPKRKRRKAARSGKGR